MQVTEGGGSSPLHWRIEQETSVTEVGPEASLVSLAYTNHEYFMVVRGDIAPVVHRDFEPQVDVPSARLDASLDVAGNLANQTSAVYGADRTSWAALLQWAGVEPAASLRVTLELDGRSRTYLLELPT